jgi:S-adenosylmethionine hydrolase
LDVGEADLVAIFGSHGYLELALSRAKLASLCGIELSASIKVVFHDADEPQQEKSTLF